MTSHLEYYDYVPMIYTDHSLICSLLFHRDMVLFLLDGKYTMASRCICLSFKTLFLLLNQLNIQLKASTFFTISHLVHPTCVYRLTIIFLTLIIIIDTHSFNDCLVFGMPFLLLIYIYLSPLSKIKLKEYFWNYFVLNFNNENPCIFHLFYSCNKCHNSPPPVSFNIL